MAPMNEVTHILSGIKAVAPLRNMGSGATAGLHATFSILEQKTR